VRDLEQGRGLGVQVEPESAYFRTVSGEEMLLGEGFLGGLGIVLGLGLLLGLGWDMLEYL
jgi:hypothetical protein